VRRWLGAEPFGISGLKPCPGGTPAACVMLAPCWGSFTSGMATGPRLGRSPARRCP